MTQCAAVVTTDVSLKAEVFFALLGVMMYADFMP
jgi:hypothetical protein